MPEIILSNRFRKDLITPDWLLIYRIDDGALILFLARTGSHSEISK